MEHIDDHSNSRENDEQSSRIHQYHDDDNEFDRVNLSENWKKQHNNNNKNKDYYISESSDSSSPSREELNEQKYKNAFTDEESSSPNNEHSNRDESDNKEIGNDKHGDSSQGDDNEKYKMFNGFKFRYGPNNNNNDDSRYSNNDDDNDENQEKKKKKKKEKKKIFPEDTDSESSSSSSSSKLKPLKSPIGGANFGVSDFTNGAGYKNNNHLGTSSGTGGSNGGSAGGGENSGETGHKIKQGEKEEGGTAPSPFEPEEKLSYHPTKLPSFPNQQQRSNSRRYNSNNNGEDNSENRGAMYSEDSPYNHEIKELSSTSWSHARQEEQDLHSKGEAREFSTDKLSSSSSNNNDDDIDDFEAFNNQGHHHHHVKGFSDNHATFRIHSKKDREQQQMMLSKKSDASIGERE